MEEKRPDKVAILATSLEEVREALGGTLNAGPSVPPAEAPAPIARKLLTVPDARLRKKCKPVKEIDGYVREVVRDLQAYLGMPVRTATGVSACIGLAASQLGELIRVYVVRLQGIDWVVINPVVVKSRGSQWSYETCDSIPGKTYKVKRAEVFKVQALDLDGRQRGYKGHGLVAAVLQHEQDHLDGIMIDEKKPSV